MTPSHTYRPRLYFLATFAATYPLWLAGAYVSYRQELSGFYMPLMLGGLLAPFLISLGMILAAKNAELKRDFFNRMRNPRLIDPKMLPAFFLIMPLAVLASLLLSLLFGEPLAQFRLAGGFSFSSFVPVFLLLLLAAVFEELGWRGYAFDSLQSRYSYLTASVLFGVLWSLWHLPLIWVKDSYQYQIVQENIWFGVNFFLSIIPMGIIISWICARNRKSVLAAVLFHFIINMSQEVLAITQITKCIETVVLTAFVLVLIATERQLFFSKRPLPAAS